MTLRNMAGFDDTTAEPGATTLGNSSLGGAGRTGPGALNVGTIAATFPLGTTASTVYVGAAHIFPSFTATNVMRFMEGATIHCGVGFDASGHATIYGPAGTVVATGTAVTPTAAWTYVEAKAVIADAGGSVEVKVDGVVVVSFAGDTRNGGTGVVDTIGFVRPGAAGHRMDDLYILDSAGSAPYNTYLGDVVVRILLPSGNGANSDWTGSDSNSIDNYLLVDEANSSSADYVGASAASKTDLYAMADIPTTDLPLATRTWVYAAKSDGGTPPVMKPVTKGDGGTVLEEAAITLSTTYQHFLGAMRTTDPDGDTLTATNVNGMQAGVRSA